MQLEIRVFAGLQKYIPNLGPGELLNLEVSDGCDGYQVLKALNIPEPEAFVFMVNGCRQHLSHRLAGGDRIGIFPPVGGG